MSAPILLFVSHSSDDAELASRLIDLVRTALNLPAECIRCTSVDGYRLPGGANTNDQLRREVYEARAFIGIISLRSARSAYVLFELGARWGAGRHLLPLLAPGVPASVLGGPISGLNALRADSAAQLLQLVNDLADQLDLLPGLPASYHAQIGRITELQLRPGQEGLPPTPALPGVLTRPMDPDERVLLSGISTEARELLSAAAQDRSGSVFVVESTQGLSLSANGREFTEAGNPRSEARGRRAMNELLSSGLIENRGGDGSMLFVTDEGFRAADLLARL